MKEEYRYISHCGRYDCDLCAYHTGDIVEAAKNLLAFVEKYRSMELIAKTHGTYDYDKFLKGLRWLASREPCKGCRFGGGWSWWPACPVRDCSIGRGVDFCYQCEDFPCKRLKEEPLLSPENPVIEANNQIKKMGIENWVKLVRKKYEFTSRA